MFSLHWQLLLFSTGACFGVSSCYCEQQQSPPLDLVALNQQQHYKAQRKCPVMDEEFGGDMGTPWVVNVKNHDVFVCCKGCIAKVQKDPEKYLAKLPAKDGKTTK